MNESKINIIDELAKKIMLEDNHVNINEYIYLEKTWDWKTINSICITLYDYTNIHMKINGDYKYTSMDSCQYGSWENYDIEAIYEYEDTIIKCLIHYLS